MAQSRTNFSPPSVQARFFVLDQFQLRYYKDVDGELMGTISLREVKTLHGRPPALECTCSGVCSLGYLRQAYGWASHACFVFCTEPESDDSTVIIIEMKSAEHTVRCRVRHTAGAMLFVTLRGLHVLLLCIHALTMVLAYRLERSVPAGAGP